MSAKKAPVFSCCLLDNADTGWASVPPPSHVSVLVLTFSFNVVRLWFWSARDLACLLPYLALGGAGMLVFSAGLLHGF